MTRHRDAVTQGRQAYSVTNEEAMEPCSVIVFAHSATRAKSIAHHSDGFDCDWTELRVKREPEADKFAETFDGAIASWDSAAGVRIYYEMDWQMSETSHCDCCCRFESKHIPESALSEAPEESGYEMVCSACIEADPSLRLCASTMNNEPSKEGV